MLKSRQLNCRRVAAGTVYVVVKSYLARVNNTNCPSGIHPPGEPAGRGREVAFEEPGFAIAEDAAVLDELMRGLTERERRVVRLRFREDLRQSQIGDLLGMSQMQVSRMLRNTLAQLQETVTSTPSSASARRLPSSERRNARRRPGGWSK